MSSSSPQQGDVDGEFQSPESPPEKQEEELLQQPMKEADSYVFDEQNECDSDDDKKKQKSKKDKI